MNLDLVREWMAKRQQIDVVSDKLKSMKAELATLEVDVLAEFVEGGVQNVKLDTATVYVHRDLRARPKAGERDELCAELSHTELAWLVQPTINTQTLAGYVREQEKAGAELPKVLADRIVTEELFSVRARAK